MIIKIKNKTDLITLDLTTKQIRYLKDFEKQGEIFFIPLSNSDIEGYEYLFKEDKKVFLETLFEDICNYGLDYGFDEEFKISLENLEITETINLYDIITPSQKEIKNE